MEKVKKSGLISLTAFLFAIVQPPSLGATPPPSVPLSLAGAIKIALENNVDIQVERENLHLRESGFIFEDSQFDPTLRLDARSDKIIRSSTSLIELGATTTNEIEQENQRLGTGLKQRLRWGGDYDLSLEQTRSSATFQDPNPTFRGTAVLTLTQPLLQGFGRQVVQGPLRIAQTDIAISRTAFRAKVSTLLFDISSAYWDLVFQKENMKVKQQALQSARQLLEANRAKVELGLLAPIEILVAEAGAASREESVVIAQKEVEDKEDELRQLLNLPEQSMVHPPPLQPTDKPMETRRRIEEGKVLEMALTQRPEIEENRLNLRNRALLVRIAKERLFPSLDFVGRVGLNGLGATYSDEFDQFGTRKFYQWEAGVVLRFPIGNREARANLQREKAERNKAV
ncbi:MAG: TolC family protein, partial [Nitrospiria bacterium]